MRNLKGRRCRESEPLAPTPNARIPRSRLMGLFLVRCRTPRISLVATPHVGARLGSGSPLTPKARRADLPCGNEEAR